ncbi:site-2 protease family protein [bacterium]|nr:site-2 protease family protein [bacterium]
MDIFNNLQWYIYAIPSLLIASTIHEYAHAWAATKLGDYTAKAEGRLTLNPLTHIDPIGALLLVIAGFGWSKPVPINEYNFEKPVLYTALTAAAGPISNFILVIACSLIFKLFPSYFLLVFIIINLSLGTFNLIPIPPLDGHKIVRALLPGSIRYFWESLEKFAPFVFLLFLLPFSPLSAFTSSLITGVIQLLLEFLGLS